MKIVVIYTTCPDLATAHRISKTLVTERHVACTNSREVQSCYIWEGDLLEEREIGLWCKSTLTHQDKAVQRLLELHPYDIPAITITTVGTTTTYGDWVTAQITDVSS